MNLQLNRKLLRLLSIPFLKSRDILCRKGLLFSCAHLPESTTHGLHVVKLSLDSPTMLTPELTQFQQLVAWISPNSSTNYYRLSTLIC